VVSPTVTQPHDAMGRELIQFPSYATSALQAAQNRKKYLDTTTAVPSRRVLFTETLGSGVLCLESTC